MKSFLRPRFWIALMSGIAVGLLGWMLPPLPSYTARLPNSGPQEFRHAPFVLMEVTSNGRFLITQGTYGNEQAECDTVHVWDRTRGFDSAVVQFEAHGPDFRMRLSPD